MKKNTKIIAGTGLLTAIVVVLQLFGSAIKFGPFSISLVLLPIVVGAALYGKWSVASLLRSMRRASSASLRSWRIRSLISAAAARMACS